VCEDNDLACRGDLLERSREAVHSRRIHRLHRIVDHDKPKGTVWKGRARKKQAQGERMQFPLAHHAEGRARNAIDGHIKRHATLTFCAFQRDAAKLHVAVQPEVLPCSHCQVGNRRKALVPNLC
jgi:hypothetical protein